MSSASQNVRLYIHDTLIDYVRNLWAQKTPLLLDIILIFRTIVLIAGFIILLCGVIHSAPILIIAGSGLIGICIFIGFVISAVLLVLVLSVGESIHIPVEKKDKSVSQEEVVTEDIEEQESDTTEQAPESGSSETQEFGFQEENMFEEQVDDFLACEMLEWIGEETVFVGNRCYREKVSIKYEYQEINNHSNSHHQQN